MKLETGNQRRILMTKNLQRKWLDKIRRMDPTDFPFRLCRAQPNGRPGYWTPWDEWDWTRDIRAEFRTLCQNELLFDMDIKDPYELYFTTTELLKHLTELGIPHYLYDSGGKGYHVQIWLDAPTTDPYEWFMLRHHVARWLVKDSGLMYKSTGPSGAPHWNIDPRKWNWVTPKKHGEYVGKGSVVRAVGGRKKSFKVLLDGLTLPENRVFHTTTVFRDIEFEKWKVPDEFIRQVTDKKPVAPVDRKVGVDLSDAVIPICILDLIERQFEGEHLEHIQRVAVVGYLYTYYMDRDGELTEDSFNKLHQIFMNDPNYDEDITAYQVRDIVTRLQHDPTRIPKCGFLRTIVDTEFCPICKAVFK